MTSFNPYPTVNDVCCIICGQCSSRSACPSYKFDLRATLSTDQWDPIWKLSRHCSSQIRLCRCCPHKLWHMTQQEDSKEHVYKFSQHKLYHYYAVLWPSDRLSKKISLFIASLLVCKETRKYEKLSWAGAPMGGGGGGFFILECSETKKYTKIYVTSKFFESIFTLEPNFVFFKIIHF